MATRPPNPSRPRKKPGSTLTRLSVTGFKSISNTQQIDIRPLTILSGANSGGKSSAIQPLLLLKQTFDAPYDPGSLLLGGQNVRLTSADQVLSKTRTSAAVREFSIVVEMTDSTVQIDFGRKPRKGLDVSRNVVIWNERAFEIRADLSDEELKPLVKSWIELGPEPKPTGLPDGRLSVSRERSLLVVNYHFHDAEFVFPVIHPGRNLVPLLAGMIHVPGLRGNPERNYPTTSIGDRFPGTFEHYVASVINHWQQSGDDRLRQLGIHLERLGLTWKVQAQQIDDTQVELRVGRLPHSKRGGAHDLVSIADVGFGVSQTLPVLAALLTAQAGQTVYIEQPEIHLHPRAQRALAVVLAEAATRGVVVIVETHSALLLRGFQTLVARDELDPNIVALHWVQRDGDGATTIQRGSLDLNGAFGEWPVDFDEVELAAETDYLNAAEHKLFQSIESG